MFQNQPRRAWEAPNPKYKSAESHVQQDGLHESISLGNQGRESHPFKTSKIRHHPLGQIALPTADTNSDSTHFGILNSGAYSGHTLPPTTWFPMNTLEETADFSMLEIPPMSSSLDANIFSDLSVSSKLTRNPRLVHDPLFGDMLFDFDFLRDSRPSTSQPVEFNSRTVRSYDLPAEAPGRNDLEGLSSPHTFGESSSLFNNSSTLHSCLDALDALDALESTTESGWLSQPYIDMELDGKSSSLSFALYQYYTHGSPEFEGTAEALRDHYDFLRHVDDMFHLNSVMDEGSDDLDSSFNCQTHPSRSFLEITPPLGMGYIIGEA
jgi:hypothetical protein